MVGVTAQIQTGHPYNTNLNRYPFIKIFGCPCVYKAVVINEQFRHSSIIYCVLLCYEPPEVIPNRFCTVHTAFCSTACCSLLVLFAAACTYTRILSSFPLVESSHYPKTDLFL